PAERPGADPGRAEVPDHPPGGAPAGVAPQGQRRLLVLPARRPDAEALRLEERYRRGMLPGLVMPVTDDHILGDAIHGRRRAVPAGLPFTVTHPAVVEQAVAPHQHGQLPRADEVPVIVARRAGEELGRVLATAPRALLAGDQEYLVHADVEGVGPEG